MFLSGLVCRVAALGIVLSVASVNLARAQSPLPAPWVSEDVGNPIIDGSSSINSSNVVTINASGADIWGTSDQFHFAYVPVSGNVDILLRVDSVPSTSTWAKIGVMIRASLAANSAHAFSLVSYSKGLAFQRRPATGGDSVNTAGEAAGEPRWVRLVRLGNLVTASSSADGVTWTTIGSDTIQLGSTAYVGIAATSKNMFASGRFVVSQVAMAIPSTLPAGQTSADIGAPALRGTTSYAGSTYSITAGGSDIWNTSDQFHYVYQQMSGDLDVKVRVASIAYADQWSKAGVMVRASLNANSAHAFALMSAGRGSAFHRRNTDGGLTVGTSGSTAAPPGWMRLKRSGNLVTAYRSTDGVNWTTIGSDSVSLPDQVYVGIAATSHTAGATTSVKADNFSAVQTAPSPPPPPPNAAPTVSLTTSGTSFVAPASIALNATASDPENQIARVEFFAGTTRLATDTAAPYSFTWTGVAAGSYALKAVVYDAQGASATSSIVNVTVSATAAKPVTLTFTTSAADAAMATDYVLEFFAATANPATATPIKRQSLGKPVLNAGTATVDITTVFNSLAAGNYIATVGAVWSGGVSRSTAISVTR